MQTGALAKVHPARSCQPSARHCQAPAAIPARPHQRALAARPARIATAFDQSIGRSTKRNRRQSAASEISEMRRVDPIYSQPTFQARAIGSAGRIAVPSP